MRTVQDDLEKEIVCGTCKYHRFDQLDRDWVCENEDSYYYSDITGYMDYCIDHKPKEEEKE